MTAIETRRTGLRVPAALKSPTILLGAVLVGVWVFAALFAPWIAPYDPLQSRAPLQLPMSRGPDGSLYLLGTDLLGRDILSRLIWGARAVVLWAGLATATAFAVGLAMGLVAGFYKGWVDKVLSFIANVILSFPVLVLYILVIVTFGASGLNIVLAVTFASAPGIFRIVRALTIDIAAQDYVAAAIVQGESPLRIMAVEILPNAAGPLIVDACLRLGYTTITIGVLGFLGLGLPPPTPDWGSMVNDGRPMAIAFPHMVIFPCIAISMMTLGLSLVADGIRELGLRHGRA
ncbi:ABC transporter permease [Chthonobacter rhizosphaerae]|uniref:ABC transporter permease n=1 Tax=Chthonobacter rhizosphaerae TaxID=2735553 RepID=UPI0015EF7FC3|nr:ABC transporter permease [Chthonobacter rhizosphaerae]